MNIKTKLIVLPYLGSVLTVFSAAWLLWYTVYKRLSLEQIEAWQLSKVSFILSAVFIALLMLRRFDLINRLAGLSFLPLLCLLPLQDLVENQVIKTRPALTSFKEVMQNPVHGLFRVEEYEIQKEFCQHSSGTRVLEHSVRGGKRRRHQSYVNIVCPLHGIESAFAVFPDSYAYDGLLDKEDFHSRHQEHLYNRFRWLKSLKIDSEALYTSVTGSKRKQYFLEALSVETRENLPSRVHLFQYRHSSLDGKGKSDLSFFLFTLLFSLIAFCLCTYLPFVTVDQDRYQEWRRKK